MLDYIFITYGVFSLAMAVYLIGRDIKKSIGRYKKDEWPIVAYLGLLLFGLYLILWPVFIYLDRKGR